MLLLIVGGIIWAVVAFSGVIAFADEGSDDPAHYAVAVFWPLFLVIFLIKGLCTAIGKVLGDWS